MVFFLWFTESTENTIKNLQIYKNLQKKYKILNSRKTFLFKQGFQDNIKVQLTPKNVFRLINSMHVK